MTEDVLTQLVRRLRDADWPPADQAADEIERLRNEIRFWRYCVNDVGVLRMRVENERLRQALTAIVEVTYYGSEGIELECDEMKKIARVALEGKKDG